MFVGSSFAQNHISGKNVFTQLRLIPLVNNIIILLLNAFAAFSDQVYVKNYDYKGSSQFIYKMSLECQEENIKWTLEGRVNTQYERAEPEKNMT